MALLSICVQVHSQNNELVCCVEAGRKREEGNFVPSVANIYE